MFVRFAGFCAALGGTLMAGLMPQAGFLRGIQPMMNRLVPGDPDGSLLLALMATFWFLGLLGAWYRHAGAERERQLLLVAPVTGALLLVLSPWGGWYFWVAAVLLFSLGLSLSGWLTLRQLEQPFRSLGALAVAGGLVPLASIILHLRLDIGPGTWLTQLGGLGWISLGVALLLARATGSNPARPVV